MSEKIQLRWFAAIVVLALSVTVAQAVTIETVPVGNLGNADDTHGAGYGAVDYAYNIGKYEVTAGQYAEFLNAVADADPYGLYNSNMDASSWGCQITQNSDSGSYTYDFSGRPSGTEADWSNRPVNFVSWGDATRFANWLHNDQPTGTLTGNPVLDADITEDGAYYLNGAMSNAELMAVNREADWKWAITSEDEWYKAAYHKNDGVTGNYFDYPTSNDSLPSSNLDGGGNNATWYNNDFGHTIGHPYYRTEVGAHENSGSPYGTFDQGGNMWEWNEADDISILSRGLRGGSFLYTGTVGDALLASERSYQNLPTTEGSDVGFRVAQVPEPGSITLLLCGLVSMIYWRRRL